MNDKLLAIFCRIFPSAKGKKTKDLSSEKLSGWDSLAHLRLIMAIEKEFGLQFETEKIPGLSSFDLIDNEISQKN
jgi:acyl carrier protein